MCLEKQTSKIVLEEQICMLSRLFFKSIYVTVKFLLCSYSFVLSITQLSWILIFLSVIVIYIFF